jgi:tRNA threonylcarbamoyl adenosine modification protein (Sua5/YciO/YrdC/YwlC family)
VTRELDLAGALDALQRGGVVAVPTDTVYGLAASIAHPQAVAKLFSLKHRPSDVALPVLVDSLDQIESLGVTWPERARWLSDAFWPGALTIIVGVDAELADLVGSTALSAGFRLPNDGLLRELIAKNGPLVVTSANEHGEAPCRTVAQLLEVFAGRPELSGALDGGQRSGTVSTVVDITGPTWRVVRQGAISRDELAAVLR